MDRTGISIDPTSMYDVQIKRIHEYKRQLLNCMNIIHTYLSIVEDGVTLPSCRTFVFGGKAAPQYYMAKLIIKLINDVAQVVNNDPRVKGQIKIVFLPDKIIVMFSIEDKGSITILSIFSGLKWGKSSQLSKAIIIFFSICRNKEKDLLRISSVPISVRFSSDPFPGF
jgi:hypothetical protein